MKEATTEKVVADAQGVYVVYSVRRKPADEQYSQEALLAVRGMPWAPNPAEGVQQELLAPLTIEPVNPEVLAAPTATFKRA